MKGKLCQRIEITHTQNVVIDKKLFRYFLQQHVSRKVNKI